MDAGQWRMPATVQTFYFFFLTAFKGVTSKTYMIKTERFIKDPEPESDKFSIRISTVPAL
jgi:hypothetical protein